MSSFFPITIVDDFFENPDAVVDFASSLEYFPSDDGRWPGLRTKPLHDLNIDFFKFFVNKKLSLFYNFRIQNVDWNVSSYFQLVKPNDTKGWTHTDYNIANSIIYLTKNIPLDCGTSICRFKKSEINPSPINSDFKIKAIKDNLSKDIEEEKREENNSKFEDVVVVSNVYNRLLMFDSSVPHRAQNFYGTEDRLTLVSFITSVSSDAFPIQRMKFL